jgi:RimJ/RimL family protein N-acetyltransferase
MPAPTTIADRFIIGMVRSLSSPAPIPWPDPPLSDAAVALRPFVESDIPALVDICHDQTVLRWTRVPRGYTEQDARDHFAASEASRRAGREIHFAIVDATSGELVGGCDLRNRDRDAGIAELGYMVGPAGRGRGMATAAVRLLTRWALETLGMRRVEILAHPENAASQRVAERAGFRRVSLLRSHREKRGKTEDRVLYVSE